MSLDYLPRSAWDARASKGPTALRSIGLLGTALHYPGMGTRRLFAQADVARALRGWQDYHMDDRGWSDIAYQVAVDQAGRIWTLRGLTTRSGANGDATVNLQYGAILLVVGDDEAPTGALINSTRQVIADFRRLYPKATAIKPHSAVRPDPTSCPGNRVRSLIAAGQFEPRPVQEDTDMTPDELLNTHVTRTLPDGQVQDFGTLRGCIATLMLRTQDDDARTNALAESLTRIEGKLS